MYDGRRKIAHLWALAFALVLLVCGAAVWAAGLEVEQVGGVSREVIFAGIVAGLVTWGGQLVTLIWLRRDVNLAHDRITEHEERYHFPRKVTR